MIIKRTLSADGKEKIEEARKVLSAAPDWHATCPKCKAELTGTPSQLRAHKCGVTHASAV